jgi:hypothetical protein
MNAIACALLKSRRLKEVMQENKEALNVSVALTSLRQLDDQAVAALARHSWHEFVNA